MYRLLCGATLALLLTGPFAVDESSSIVSTVDPAGSAADDFPQAATATDGAEADLTTALDGINRTLRLTFLRKGPPTTRPFTLDADGLSIVMTDRSGRSRRFVTSETGKLVSRLSTSDFIGMQDAKGQQILTLDFPLASDLPEGIYFPHLRTRPIVRDSKGETLGVARDLSDFITTTTDAELDRLRKRYLGKDVFALVNGDVGTCTDTKTVPSLTTSSPLAVVSITRKVGLVERLSLDAGVPLSFNPYAIVLERTTPSDRERPCSTVTTTLPGAWAFERSFSSHPAIDPRWPRRIRIAHTPMVGMTHAMVAAVWGYPRGLDSVAELSRQSEWDYDVFDIIKFHGDRVSAVVMKNQP
jgi:hypothetical protein